MAISLSYCRFALFSCNTNSGTAQTSAADSVATARAAKDSILAKNKATALSAIQGINSGNINELINDMAPNAVDYGDGGIPPVKGKDSIGAFVKALFTAFPDYHGSNFMAIAEGNQVAVFADWTGTFKGPLMGMKPTGKTFHVKDCDLITFDDAGKMTEHHSVQSFMNILAQVGAKMK